MRTGEIYYDILAAYTTVGGQIVAQAGGTGITPSHIAYFRNTDTAVPGAGEAAGYTVDLSAIIGGRLFKVNPLTGAVTANVTLPTFNSTYGSNYEIFFQDGYYHSFQGINSTTSAPAAGINITTAYGGYFIKWSSAGTSTNFTTRIVSNVSVILPRSFRTIYQISDYGNVGAAIDYESMISVQQHRFLYGGFYGYVCSHKT